MPLYRIADGPLRLSNYGLKMARLLSLPEAAMGNAHTFAQAFGQAHARKRHCSRPTITQKRRRLILDLREHLRQLQEGTMQREPLAEWLMSMRKEFVIRFKA